MYDLYRYETLLFIVERRCALTMSVSHPPRPSMHRASDNYVD